ncbi:MAG: hypothetical protein WBW99_21465, partial [Pseudolabrys sp.]
AKTTKASFRILQPSMGTAQCRSRLSRRIMRKTILTPRGNQYPLLAQSGHSNRTCVGGKADIALTCRDVRF